MQFVETEMGKAVDPNFVNVVGGFIPMEMVVKGIAYMNLASPLSFRLFCILWILASFHSEVKIGALLLWWIWYRLPHRLVRFNNTEVKLQLKTIWFFYSQLGPF